MKNHSLPHSALGSYTMFLTSGARRNGLQIQDGRGMDGGTIRDDRNVETTAPNSAATFKVVVTYA